MNSGRVLIVDNDPLSANQWKHRIESYGYMVVGIVATGRQAIAFIEDTAVNLLLVNTALDEDINSTIAADSIWAHHRIPCVNTASRFDSLVHRPVECEQCGNLFGPTTSTDIQTQIKNALLRSREEKKNREREHSFLTILNSIACGVVALDSQRYITFLNPIAELLMGWKSENAHGAGIERILTTAQPKKSQEVYECISDVLRDGGMHTILDVALQSQNNTHTFIDVSIAPIRSDRRKIEGAVLAFRDASERRRWHRKAFGDASEQNTESPRFSPTPLTNKFSQQGRNQKRLQVSSPAPPLPMQNEPSGAYPQERELQPKQHGGTTNLEEQNDDHR